MVDPPGPDAGLLVPPPFLLATTPTATAAAAAAAMTATVATETPPAAAPPAPAAVAPAAAAAALVCETVVVAVWPWKAALTFIRNVPETGFGVNVAVARPLASVTTLKAFAPFANEPPGPEVGRPNVTNAPP